MITVDRWWQYAPTTPGDAQGYGWNADEYIATPEVSKHRIFVWVEAADPLRSTDSMSSPATTITSSASFILASTSYGRWRMGTQLREAESGFRYTPTTCFETFPFPWPPGQEPADDPRVEAIAQAARELVQLRDAWLNPPGASDAELKKRTLTNLYNARPTWLDNAHRKLDAAVFAAYGWPADLSDDEILARLLALNLARAGGK